VSGRLFVTNHAVERFVERWRPRLTFAQARAELEGLANRSTRLRRRAVRKDADLFTVSTEIGESLFMPVRQGVVLTVFGDPVQTEDDVPPASDPDPLLALEAAAARDRWREAERLLADWRAGLPVPRPTI
jgi:hypothetical protein